MRRFVGLFVVTVIAMFLVIASAHIVIGPAHGFVLGFAHPLSGIDHILAMVAVGVFAAHQGGRAVWLVPLTFVAVMAIGGLMGMAGIGLPFVEFGIGLSVVVLSLVVALQLDLPTVAAIALVGFFAIFHGHAHGVEMPESAGGLAYGAGFVCATALLHAVGVGLGLAIGKPGKEPGQKVVA